MALHASLYDGAAPARHVGGGVGLEVWIAPGDPRVRAALLLGHSGRTPPVVLVNRRAIGTEDEGRALAWALATIAERGPGFYVLRAE